MDVRGKIEKSFLNGQWNTYSIDEVDQEIDLTPSLIHRGLHIFSNSYTVEKDVFAIEDLICIVLYLEEIPAPGNRNVKKKKSSSVKQSLKAYKFKLALSADDSLLFCHRMIPEVLRNKFADVFHATSLTPYDLSGSPPLQLLMMHRQAVNAALNFSELTDIYSLNCIKESRLASTNEVYLKIGPPELPMPQIRKLTCQLQNFKFSTEDNNNKQDIVIKNVNVEMNGPSLFDLYRALAEKNIISSVPEWVEASRQRGKTHRTVVFQ